MERYKKSYGKIKFIYIIIFLIFIFPININARSFINIDGYLINNDIPKFSNVLKNEKKDLFIILNSSGGRIETIFKIINNLIKIKKKGVKIYTIIYNNSSAYAGAFFIVMFSDIVFYSNPLNLGVFTPLSNSTYKSQKRKFDNIFLEIAKNNINNEKIIKKLFFNGDMFKTELFSTLKIKFIQIENLEDIQYSINDYKNINIINNISWKSYLYTPNFIFFIFNLSLILIFISVYFTRNILFSALSLIFIAIFIFLSFEITISLKAVFAIFFTHFILIFKEYIKLKYIIFVLSFSIFILSSIYLINPLNSNYYIDTGFRVDISVIFIIAVFNILVYKMLLLFFNKRFRKFNSNKNELKYQKAKVVNTFPLTINVLGDNFPAVSINKLFIGNTVKIIGFKGIKVIVESSE